MKIVKHKIQMIVIYTEEIQIHGLPKGKMHMVEQMFTSRYCIIHLIRAHLIQAHIRWYKVVDGAKREKDHIQNKAWT